MESNLPNRRESALSRLILRGLHPFNQRGEPKDDSQKQESGIKFGGCPTVSMGAQQQEAWSLPSGALKGLRWPASLTGDFFLISRWTQSDTSRLEMDSGFGLHKV